MRTLCGCPPAAARWTRYSAEVIAAPWCAAHAVPARACARCTGARAPLCSVRAAPPVRKRVQRAPIDAPPRAGIPAGVVTELLLRVDPLLPARPRTDYDVVAHALQGAGGPVRSRVCVIEAGDLFSVASLEKALQAHPQINLQAALDAVDIRRAGDLATLGVCVQQLCLSAAGQFRYCAVIAYGISSLYPGAATRGEARRIVSAVTSLADLARAQQVPMLLCNQVHFRDGGVYYSGPAACGADSRTHLVGCASANVVGLWRVASVDHVCVYRLQFETVGTGEEEDAQHSGQ